MQYSFNLNFRNGETKKCVVEELTPSNVSGVFVKMELQGEIVTEIAMNKKTYNVLINAIGNSIEDGRLWTASIVYNNDLMDNTFNLSSNKDLNRYK